MFEKVSAYGKEEQCYSQGVSTGQYQVNVRDIIDPDTGEIVEDVSQPILEVAPDAKPNPELICEDPAYSEASPALGVGRGTVCPWAPNGLCVKYEYSIVGGNLFITSQLSPKGTWEFKRSSPDCSV